MSFFSVRLSGWSSSILVLLRQVRVRPGAAGVPAATAGDHRGHRPLRAVRLRRRPPRLRLGLGLGARHPAGRRAWGSARCAACPCGSGPARWVLRQGTAVTMVLWLVSLLVHFVGDAGGYHAGAAGLEASSFLLYLGLTLGVQDYVVHRRAQPLWAQLGPDAGRPLQMNFTQGPGVFFTTFRAAGRSRRPAGAPAGGARARRPERDRRRGGRGRRRRAARAATRRADRPYTRRP